MNTTELKLRERIKELTCLYEVSSIIVNTDINSLSSSLEAIIKSLKKAFQYPSHTEIALQLQECTIQTGKINNQLKIYSPISLFNKPSGKLIVSLAAPKSSFLKEEKQLLDSVAYKITNLLERIEIKRNENSLRRQVERADRLNILGEITAGIAHELNTPLTNILGFSELLKEKFNSTDTAAIDLEKIIQNAIFSREVVKKLMFFACEMPQERKKINIVPTIKNAIDLLNPTLRKKQITCNLKMEDELWLKADVLQITQVIFNLIMNAVYFTPLQGTITVEAYQLQKEMILKVIDEGTGLSEEAKQKLFEPFFTTKPVGKGSGLGLSVVHGIVGSHQGTITAKNNPSLGTTFTIQLPLY